MKKIMFFCLFTIMAMLPVQANTREEVEFGKCTDGDTAHFKIDGKDTTVRFLAINAPEYTKTKEPYGKEASAYVCDALKSAETIELEYDDGSEKLDKYGRTLALAEVKYLYGDYAYTKELQTLEKEAKKEKINMWSDGKAAKEAQYDTVQYVLGAAGGVVLIIFGLFFAKGKHNKQRYIRKGVKQLRKK